MGVITLGLALFSLACIGVFVKVQRRINKIWTALVWSVTTMHTTGVLGGVL